MHAPTLTFREGSTRDLEATFALSERAIYDTAARQGIVSAGREPDPLEIHGHWMRMQALMEFMSAQPGGRYVICEAGEEPVGFVRVVRFGEVEELTELMVAPGFQDQGLGRELLGRCWGEAVPSDVVRVVVAAGAPRDLSLYSGFGLMPLTGHWHMRQGTDAYLERRSRDTDVPEPTVHVLTAERAVAEWNRLEPGALGRSRSALHSFFGHDRTCLALMDEAGGEAAALCWVSAEAEIGPAVGRCSDDLVPVVLAALDRVAKVQEPPVLSLFACTATWSLVRRLRTVGFRVHWPSWVMASQPLPGLDRYMPTRPPNLL